MLRNPRFFLDRLLHRDRLDADMNEEIELHIGQRMQELTRRGLASDEALRRARMEFGAMERYKERCRETRRFHLLHDFLSDLRYGARTLRNAPGFAIVAVLTLALGIGTNSAIFSLVHSVLLKSLPVGDPGTLHVLNWSRDQKWIWPESLQMDNYGWGGRTSDGRYVDNSFSLDTFHDFRSHAKSFSEVFGFGYPADVNADGMMVNVQLVSGNFFSVLGVKPAVGRLFIDKDDLLQSEPVAVISYEFWRDHFSSDAKIVGRKLTVNTHPLTIIGVAPQGFFGVHPRTSIDVYAPLHVEGELNTMAEPAPKPGEPAYYLRPNLWWVEVMGRLAPGAKPEQAQAELNGLMLQQLGTLGIKNVDPAHGPRVEVHTGRRGLDELKEDFSQPLLVLSCIVGLVLLIACGNVANLLLVRGTTRTREIAVRLSLGARRARIVRQLLTESLLLAVVGAALGLVLAVWTSRLLLTLLAPPQVGYVLSAHVDGVVIAFTALVAIITSAVFGVVPAFRSGRVDLTSALKSSGSATLAPREAKLSEALVISQVSLSILLLVGAGLFVRTLNNLRNTNLGFDRNNLLLFGLDPALSGYHGQKLRSLLDEITAQIQLVPGVRSVAFAHVTPISDNMSGGDVSGDLPGHANDEAQAMYNVVGTDYFQTTRMNLLAGRNFGPQDTLSSTPVAVISKRLAKKLFGDESPIGHTLHKDVHVAMYKGDYQIIGVVADAKYADVKSDVNTYFLPYEQAQEVLLRGPSFVVRTRNDPHSVIAGIRRAVAQVDPQLPIRDLRTQVEQIDLSLSQEILFADLTSTFGALALLLACVGLYGTMAYSVSRRTREIGIRVALGADQQSLRAMVLREGLLVVATGIVIGIPAAIGLSRLVASLLWGVRPLDVQSLIAAPLLLIVVAVIAIAVPTHRATQVDPMLALRCE